MKTTLGLFALGFAVSIAATTATIHASSAVAAPKACATPEFRQFDFWVGNWTVNDRNTKQFAGTNDVTREFGGCVVQEHWKAPGAFAGSSFNEYDATRKVWHQTWVDTSGQLLVLEGGMQNGSMVMSGTGVGKHGRFVQRIVWTPLPDGTVRQHWQVRGTNSATWRDAFDGIYKRV